MPLELVHHPDSSPLGRDSWTRGPLQVQYIQCSRLPPLLPKSPNNEAASPSQSCISTSRGRGGGGALTGWPLKHSSLSRTRSAGLLPLCLSLSGKLLGGMGSSSAFAQQQLGAGSGGGSGGGSSSSGSRSKVDPPNLEQLCEKARLSLTPDEVADFTPKIASVVDWFSQLQDVDLENVAPAVRVGELDGASYLRADVPVVFQEGDSMLAAAPEREGPYLKVPKILREEQ